MEWYYALALMLGMLAHAVGWIHAEPRNFWLIVPYSAVVCTSGFIVVGIYLGVHDPRDVYMVMGAPKNSTVEFRAKGRVELWDPWTGAVRPLRVTRSTMPIAR